MLLLITLPGMNMTIQRLVVNGNSISVTAQGQQLPLQDSDKKRYQEQAYPFTEINFLKNGYTLQLAPSLDEINGKDVYVVTVTSPSGTVSKKYYDASTGFKLKYEIYSDQGTATFMYDDYKEVSGVMLPYKIDISQQVEFTLNVTDAKINSGLADTDFK